MIYSHPRTRLCPQQPEERLANTLVIWRMRTDPSIYLSIYLSMEDEDGPFYPSIYLSMEDGDRPFYLSIYISMEDEDGPFYLSIYLSMEDEDGPFYLPVISLYIWRHWQGLQL